MQNIEPIFENNYYTIVFSFNDNYCKYFAVTLKSLIENSNNSKYYDIVVFSSDISKNNSKLLKEMLPQNFNLRIFDISNFITQNFPNIKLTPTEIWSKDIYNRIFIPFLMPNYSKVLYLDSDLIINNPIDELFDIDFNGKEILAIKDTTSQILHIEEQAERKEHIKNILKLSNATDYFNSGVLMFNIKAIDRKEYFDKIIKAFSVTPLFYLDQDILNMIFQHSTKFISSKFNFCCGEFIWRENFQSLLIDTVYSKDIESSINNPTIIHYTTRRKPWNSTSSLHFDRFWYFAKKTPFYEDILYNRTEQITKNLITENIKHNNLYSIIQSDKKILFWGATEFLEKFIKNFAITNDNIMGIIDRNPNKQGNFIGKYEIFPPTKIKDLKANQIIITIINSTNIRKNEIETFLEKNNLDLEVKTI